jgi:acyl-CoA reductase-like NAD-dependent aldehyde dehydrogenase
MISSPSCSGASTARPFPAPRGDIQRGLEVVEFAIDIGHAMKGEYTEGAGPGIDIYSIRRPPGVVTGIAPLNFPAIIPMWKFASAIACGNPVILKPWKRDPGVPMKLAELMMQRKLPVVRSPEEVVRLCGCGAQVQGGAERGLRGLIARLQGA